MSAYGHKVIQETPLLKDLPWSSLSHHYFHVLDKDQVCSASRVVVDVRPQRSPTASLDLPTSVPPDAWRWRDVTSHRFATCSKQMSSLPLFNSSACSQTTLWHGIACCCLELKQGAMNNTISSMNNTVCVCVCLCVCVCVCTGAYIL